MSRTSKADRISHAFIEALKSQGGSVATMSDLATDELNSTIRDIFLSLGRSGREVYLVRGVGFINLHVRSAPPGWWSILKTVKNDLDILAKEFGSKCFYVLLIGRDDQHVANGYILTDLTNPPLLRQPGVEKTKYTVNEKSHLDASKLLLSVDKVAKLLLQMRG